MEPIGVASGLLSFVTFAFQSTISLHALVKSFQCHQQRVRELLDELDALHGVLRSLTDTIQAVHDIDFSGLKIPLQRCGNACADFEKEISKCSSRADGSRTSFRGWARLRYMGDDIDGFRRLLASYKLTINVALADANLRKSSATAESIESYNDLIDTTRADLEDRLESMDSKLELMLQGNATVSEKDAREVKLIQEERLSTEKCLQICAELSNHIAQIQLTAKHRSTQGETVSMDQSSQRITSEGLQECKDSLSRTAKRLEGYEKELFTRLLNKSATAITSDEDRADLARLRDEWEATRQSVDICAKAHEHLRDNVSIIDNYATGDAVQFMVSTGEKTIHGHNRGLGWRTRQVGGHIDKEALQEIARTLNSATIPALNNEGPLPPSDTLAAPDATAGSELDATFVKQYGKGCKLTPNRQ